ncbi:MAG: NAD-dependent epimerase/dehydratase family protein [Promethearchaeota archaeon]
MSNSGISKNGKQYLVDGAKGHTGTFLVKILLEKEKDCKIVATDLPTDTRKELMTKETLFSKDLGYMLEILDDPRVEFIPADLTKPETLKALFKDRKYDVIFHPASLYDYFAKLDILRKINVEGTRNLLNIISETQDLDKVRFIHWSTCGVYGEPSYKYDKKTKYVIPADETALYNPPNNYSISKMEQELIVKEFEKEKGLKATIIRPAPIYGPYQTYGTYHILLVIKVMGNSGMPIMFPKKHRLMFPSIHVEDLVRAAVFLSNKEESIGEAYNIIHDMVFMDDWIEWLNQKLGIKYTIIPIWFPFFKFIAKLIIWIGKKRDKKARKLGIRPLLDVPMLKYITHQYAFSNKKLKDLGFTFKYDTWSGFKETIDWYIEHAWLPTEQNGMEVY